MKANANVIVDVDLGSWTPSIVVDAKCKAFSNSKCATFSMMKNAIYDL